MQPRRIGEIALFAAAIIWGAAFSFQVIAMDSMLPLTFTWVRAAFASLILGLFILIRSRVRPEKSLNKLGTKKGFLGALFAGVWLGFAMMAQQIGLVGTSAGKAGFFTSLYLLIVPLLYMAYGKKVNALQWGAIAIGIAGLFLLSTGGNVDGGITFYDGVILLCALLYALQILVIDFRGPHYDSIAFSLVQFVVAGVINFIGAMIFEGFDASFLTSQEAILSLSYTAIFSSCIAFTLQIVGQKMVGNPTVSSLIMSFEAVFAAIAGFVILGETLNWIELLGAILMFTALVIANLDINFWSRFTSVKPKP